MRTLALLFIVVSQANAYTLRYRVAKPDPEAILQRAEMNCGGLRLAANCPHPKAGEVAACAVNGYLMTGGGAVLVALYTRTNKADPRITPVTVDAALKNCVGQAVLGR